MKFSNNFKKRVSKGFTIVEIMIVLGVIGVLAAVALPAYADYSIKAQISEVILIMDKDKGLLNEHFVVNYEWPATHNSTNISREEYSDYLSGVQYHPGPDPAGVFSPKITYTLTGFGNPAVDGKTISLKAKVNTGKGTINWRCGPGTDPNTALEQKYLPHSCQG